MRDLKDLLDEAVAGYETRGDEADVRRLVQRRKRRGRIMTTAVALTVFAGAGWFGWTALHPVAETPPVTDPGTDDATPTAESIVRDGGPQGQDLAAALGLTFHEGPFEGGCQAYVEVEESGGGYCIEGVADTLLERSIIGKALQGRVPTREEVKRIRRMLEAQELPGP